MGRIKSLRKETTFMYFKNLEEIIRETYAIHMPIFPTFRNELVLPLLNQQFLFLFRGRNLLLQCINIGLEFFVAIYNLLKEVDLNKYMLESKGKLTLALLRRSSGVTTSMPNSTIRALRSATESSINTLICRSNWAARDFNERFFS